MVIKIGTNVGNWLVKSEKFIDKNIYWCTCECICGTVRNVRLWHLNNYKTKGCGCSNIKGRFRYKGVGDLSKAYFTSFKKSRISKGKYFSEEVNIDFLWGLFLKQQKKCAISGVDIVLNPQWSSQNKGVITDNTQTASLDRIDSSLGYSTDNVQWVHKSVNLMKGQMDDRTFIEFCRIIADNNIKLFKEENTPKWRNTLI